MKLLIAAFVLLVAGSTEAYWGGLGAYGMYGMYGGMGYGYGMGMGYGMWGKRSVEEREMPTATTNRTECVFLRDSTMLSCRGLTGVVECETKIVRPETPETTTPFTLYGLSRSEGLWGIMPRKMDNTQWLDNNKAELYWSAEESTRYGLRVADEKCYQKMDELLQASLRNERVYYTKITGEQDITTMRADLVITQSPFVQHSEKEVHLMKEWLGKFWGNWYFQRGHGNYYGKRSDGPVLEIKQDVTTTIKY